MKINLGLYLRVYFSNLLTFSIQEWKKNRARVILKNRILSFSERKRVIHLSYPESHALIFFNFVRTTARI